MGFVRLRTVWCALLLLTAPAQARDEAFSTTADFALIEDYDTGAVLYEKNADEPMPPASTAKLLTAEIVFRELKEGRLHLDDIFDVSEKAWREGGAHGHGAAMFLAIHSHVRVEDLLRGLLIQSGNDAAMTLAEGLAGSEDNFAETMNKRAAELGMTHSHFANSRGKLDPNQHVTARDMALLAAHVIRDYPEYYHYFGEKDFTWDKIHQLNRNPLLTMDIGADGLKAGDVADGGFALVGSAVQDNQRLIVVMNGLKSATERSEEARKLFNYGFHSFDRRTLYGAGDRVGSASVYGGESDEVPLVTDQPIALFVPRGESDRLVAKIVYTGPLAAPVEAGRDAARLKIWRGDMLVVDAPLKTGAPVALGGLTRRAFDAGIELGGDAVRRALKKQ
ncbi:MAG: D-alanyl-D-alanine carboxypeptidase [Hyphomicrobiales bacterium]|nr:D-alanyl-D-alanine carboxypeptidase [Hyphomicrobiales bacterium]MBV8443494.1 D-alanyl-D-alanine carboxypeptidase [Hyphomicrobiales bacterium]